MHEETTGAAELVGLHRQHLDGQFLVGQVSTGELEALRHLDLVDVHCARLRVGAAGLQLLEAVLAEVDLIATRGVVVGGHRFSLSCIDVSLGVSNVKDVVSVPGSAGRFLTLPPTLESAPASAEPYLYCGKVVRPRARHCSRCDRGDIKVGVQASRSSSARRKYSLFPHAWRADANLPTGPAPTPAGAT